MSLLFKMSSVIVLYLMTGRRSNGAEETHFCAALMHNACLGILMLNVFILIPMLHI